MDSNFESTPMSEPQLSPAVESTNIPRNTAPSAPTVEDLSSDEEDGGNINPWIHVESKKNKTTKSVSYAAAASSNMGTNRAQGRKFIIGKSSKSSELRSSKKRVQLFTSH